MIANNKYTRVVVIAVINIVIVCFVYNNTATHNSDIVLEQVGEDKDHEDKEVGDKHGDTNSTFDKHSDKDVNNKRTLENEDKSAIDIRYAKINDRVSDKTVKSSKEDHQNSTKHDAVMSMKNLLSVHMTVVKVTKNTTLPPPQGLGKELQEKLLDSSEIDLSPPNPVIVPPSLPLTDQDSYKSLQLTRTNQLHRECAGHRMGGVISNQMYVLETWSLVWCPVYKAASTNWMHNLLHLAGKKEEEIKKIIKDHPNQPNDQARIVAPVSSLSNIERISRKEDARLLLIVRHPFDRLVSAFRDKLEQCHGPENCTLDNNWYYKKYGKSIVSQYRKKAIEKFGDSFFDEKNNFGAPLPVMRTWRSSAYPSWWEFVQYVLHTSPSSYDEHWKPSSLYCSVCSFPYNNILHFETIVTEEKFFAEEMGAEDLIHPRWENRNDEGLKKEEILGKYFSLLDDQDIDGLYKIYEDDFKMFGYQFQYRNLAFNV